jgi:hypothetical protein
LFGGQHSKNETLKTEVSELTSKMAIEDEVNMKRDMKAKLQDILTLGAIAYRTMSLG